MLNRLSLRLLLGIFGLAAGAIWDTVRLRVDRAHGRSPHRTGVRATPSLANSGDAKRTRIAAKGIALAQLAIRRLLESAKLLGSTRHKIGCTS